jgi:predicted amidohydrolase YtcJ
MLALYNARIYTMDQQKPLASALLIDGERLLLVGSDTEILAEANPKTEKIDLSGRTILPGLTDAHLHLELYARSLQNVNAETASLQECLQRVAERAGQTPAGSWILGHGWNQNVWPEGFGTAHDLDLVAPDHLVYLVAKSAHAGWANSLALQAAGITAGSRDPSGGVIQRAADGQPTGILFEAAVALVEQVIPEQGIEVLGQTLDQAQKSLWKLGITSVHDFDLPRCFAALEWLHERQQLYLRVVKSIPLDYLPQAVELGLRSGFGDATLQIGPVKLFADGALGPRTAAMLAPYENEVDYAGMLLLDTEQILEYGQQAARNGLRLAIHAIGDRANHEVINAYGQLREFESNNHLPHLRYRIEHVQLLHPDDLERLAKFEIIASMQPIHATSDMLIADRHWGKRSAYAYAWRSLLQNGTALVFGSDAPVENPNPFWGIHAAVTRRRMDGSPGADGWYPEQRLSLQDALAGFTTGPAFSSGMEKSLGKLAAGFYADLITLDVDPFSIDPQQLYDVRPQATMIGGRWVWQS